MKKWLKIFPIFLKKYSRFFTDSINLNDDSVKQVDKQLFDSANIQDLFSTIAKYNRVFHHIFSRSEGFELFQLSTNRDQETSICSSEWFQDKQSQDHLR